MITTNLFLPRNARSTRTLRTVYYSLHSIGPVMADCRCVVTVLIWVPVHQCSGSPLLLWLLYSLLKICAFFFRSSENSQHVEVQQQQQHWNWVNIDRQQPAAKTAKLTRLFITNTGTTDGNTANTPKGKKDVCFMPIAPLQRRKCQPKSMFYHVTRFSRSKQSSAYWCLISDILR